MRLEPAAVGELHRAGWLVRVTLILIYRTPNG